MCVVQGLARCRRNVASLVRRVLRRKVCVLVQWIRDATGHLRSGRLRRDWWHGRNSTLWKECRDSTSRAAHHVVFLGVPAPFLLQMVMDESDPPSRFLFDLLKYVDHLFLLSADSEILASDCKAPNGG